MISLLNHHKVLELSLTLDRIILISVSKKQEIQRVKGKPKKSGFKCFYEINDDIQNFREITQNSSQLVCNPVGLINYSNDCFFTIVIQVLFSLQLFCEHVSNFDEHSSHTTDSCTIAAASSKRNLFIAMKEIKAASDGPLMTHNYILVLNLQSYVENQQFDAQECLSYIVELLVQKEKKYSLGTFS